MAKKESTIEIQTIEIEERYITIVGDSDIVLNKMDRPTEKSLIDARKDKAKSMTKVNEWEKIITSLHWRDSLDEAGDPKEWTFDTMEKLIAENAPCISAFGLYKSFGQSVVRNEIDTYSTKFNSNVIVCSAEGTDGLIPISFEKWTLDEKLMQPVKGGPVLARLNRFSNWEATFKIRFNRAGKYSLEQIVNIINLAGFGLGIGSGRSSGYGRYHVAGVK